MDTKAPEKFDLESRHSTCVVLIFNIPDESWVGDTERSIAEGLREKWKREENDPQAERLTLLYCNPDDLYAVEGNQVPNKFEALSRVDNRSLICIIGHCYEGSEYIYSDPIYESYDEGVVSESVKVSKQISYRDIGRLLLTNITNKDILFNLGDEKVTVENIYPNSLNQRLRICVPSCYSGSDEISADGEVLSASFASHLFMYLVGDNGAACVLKCNVIGAKALVIPIATEPYFLDTAKFLITAGLRRLEKKLGFDEKISTGPEVDTKQLLSEKRGFHVRYGLIDNNVLMSIFPRYRPDDIDFEVMFCITENKQSKGKLLEETLSTSELNNRLEQEMLCERQLVLCQVARELYPENKEMVQSAIEVENDILNGALPDKVLVEAISEGPFDLPKTPSFF